MASMDISDHQTVTVGRGEEAGARQRWRRLLKERKSHHPSYRQDPVQIEAEACRSVSADPRPTAAKSRQRPKSAT